jgi:hypothetical protein
MNIVIRNSIREYVERRLSELMQTSCISQPIRASLDSLIEERLLPLVKRESRFTTEYLLLLHDVLEERIKSDEGIELSQKDRNTLVDYQMLFSENPTIFGFDIELTICRMSANAA